jgi:hypothetical protein
LWVTQPEFWSQLQGGQLDRGLSVEWTCANDTLPGDVALLYRADMAKGIAYLFRVDREQPWLDTIPFAQTTTPTGARRRSCILFGSRSCSPTCAVTHVLIVGRRWR